VNHLVFIIMDSCRYDACEAARTPNLDRLGRVERRYSYASWTSPSHYTFLMGMMPHLSPKGVFASEVYKQDFAQWIERLGVADMSFKSFVPFLSLPKVLKELGYRTVGRVSLPVLNPFTTFSAHFDDYRLMDDHNDFAGMVRDMAFPEDTPTFHFCNLGETHYPYMLEGEDLPVLHGVNGVFKNLDDFVVHQGDHVSVSADQAARFFNVNELKRLRDQQVACVEHVDGVLGTLFDKAPTNTHVVVTADHGELFGEDGYFGHGPILHDKVFEVPFVEGRVP
jgi:hypothetical protein